MQVLIDMKFFSSPASPYNRK